MDLEIQFLLEHLTEKNPRLLMDQIQRMASGEAQYFSATLSLLYDGLVKRAFAQSSGGGFWRPTLVGAPTIQVSGSTPSVDLPSTSGVPFHSLQEPPPTPVPEPGPLGAVWLECFQCGEYAQVTDLYDGLRCPQCPSRSAKKGRPFMKCSSCKLIRAVRRNVCIRLACQARFM